jgi:hypothetical protein
VAAGVPAVGITTGQPRQVLVDAGACILIDSFHDLLAVAQDQESGSSSGGKAGGQGGGVRAAAVRVQA